MSDPIADLLARIKNGYLAGHRSVTLPYSKILNSVSQIICRAGFLSSVKIEGKRPLEKKLVLGLKYQERKPAIMRIRKISTPGRRYYARADKIPLVKQGFGITIVSTSSGLMTGQEAKKKNLGGEVICQIW